MFAAPILLSVLATLGLSAATPLDPAKRDSQVTDTTILQYATVLEDLEAYFYQYYLNKFSADDFRAAGQSEWVRGRVEQIGSHEAQHSQTLRAALGPDAPPTCNYTFPVTSVESFLATAAVIESVGVSAYLGAAAEITTPAYLTVAASILTVEARHQGWLNSAVLKQSAWSGPFDTPVSFSPVFTIASQFITGCSGPLPLPFSDFPALAIDLGSGALTYANPSDSNYLALYSGLDAKALPIAQGKVQLPVLQGFAYALVVNTSNIADVADANTVAGPYIIDVPFTSKAANPVPAY